MPLVILHHLLNVSVQLANTRGLKKTEVAIFSVGAILVWAEFFEI
jgi:hypothetical protein